MSSLDAENEICRLNAALERRVAERTAQLEAVNLALLREIAERHHAEFEIGERERQLQAVTDNTTTILARVDANQRYLFCNRALADRFFLTPQEMIGKSMQEVFPPDGYAIMKPHIERALAGHEVTYDAVLPYRNPGPRHVHMSYLPEFDEQGSVRGVVISALDLTELYQAKQNASQTLQRLERVFESISDGFLVLAPDWQIEAINGEAERVFGRSRHELAGRAIWDEFPELAEGVFRTKCNEAAATKSTVTFETYVAQAGLWIEVRAFPSPEGLSVYVRDITKSKDADEERQRLADHIRLLLESTEEGIYGLDLSGHCTFINQAGAKMLGYTPNELQGKALHRIIHHSHPDGTDYPLADCQILKAVTDGESCAVEHEVFWHKNGTALPVAYRSHPMKSAEGVVGAVVTFSDITERAAIERERERLLAEAIDRADRDPLTGLLNHRAFQKRLSEEADRAQRTGEQLGVAIMDLNNFKFFNDAYGHLAGDEVLISISRALQSACRSYDVLARFGGDEFALLLPSVGQDERAGIIERLTEAVAAASYLPQDHTVPIPLSISVGLAFFPSGVATRMEVLAAADEDLRLSKTGGDEIVKAGIQLRHELLATVKGYEMLNALVCAVDNKDRYTSKHSEDVMYSCLQIAQEFGWDDARKRVIAIAALLHDVGKIGVPDKILRKPGRLTEDEFALMQQHPEMGAVIVAAVPGFEETLDAIRHHHEQWDGTGYPDSLAGDAIPQIARILAVADAFSAMTTNRPYRKGMPEDQATAILCEGSGTQWDPDVVRAFLNARESLKTLSNK